MYYLICMCFKLMHIMDTHMGDGRYRLCITPAYHALRTTMVHTITRKHLPVARALTLHSYVHDMDALYTEYLNSTMS